MLPVLMKSKIVPVYSSLWFICGISFRTRQMFLYSSKGKEDFVSMNSNSINLK